MSNKTQAPLTINDVARIAGVSKRTVSRVINGSAKVNAETRAQIEKIIRQTSYKPSAQARGLASKRSYLLGVFYNDPNAIFIQAAQVGCLSVCNDLGYELIVHPLAMSDANPVEQVLQTVKRAKLEGAIILPPISANEELASALKEAGVKYVRVAANKVDVPECTVVSDDRNAMKEVVDLFLAHGHREIGFITGPENRTASTERFEGFRDYLRQQGIELKAENIAVGDFTYVSGWTCAETLLGRKNRPTAIFASNDEMAIGLIHKAQDLGIAVPEDLIVVGFDDGPLAQYMRPSLTTLSRPSKKLAQLATRKLLSAINGNIDGMATLPAMLTPRLIERDSTAEKISTPKKLKT